MIILNLYMYNRCMYVSSTCMHYTCIKVPLTLNNIFSSSFVADVFVYLLICLQMKSFVFNTMKILHDRHMLKDPPYVYRTRYWFDGIKVNYFIRLSVYISTRTHFRLVFLHRYLCFSILSGWLCLYYLLQLLLG